MKKALESSQTISQPGETNNLQTAFTAIIISISLCLISVLIRVSCFEGGRIFDILWIKRIRTKSNEYVLMSLRKLPGNDLVFLSVL